jgi:hypothetical protein
MGERWLEVCLGKAQFFGETQEQHYSSGMNRPEGFRTLLQLVEQRKAMHEQMQKMISANEKEGSDAAS